MIEIEKFEVNAGGAVLILSVLGLVFCIGLLVGHYWW